MKLVFKPFLLLISITLLFSECKKKTETPAEEETPATPTNPTGINTIAEVFTTNGSPTQTFTVSATAASTITVNGVKIEIPANAFVTNASAAVTGSVELSVKTILTKSQVVLNGAGANSSGARLVTTKGCVKITASQNTQSLRLIPTSSGTMVVSVPDGTATPSPMKKYYTAKVTAVDSTKIWALGTDVNDIPTAYDAGTSQYVHKASLDSLKWLNVGVQYDSIAAPKTVVTASVNSSQFNKSNTAVYLSFNGSLTVGAMYEVSPGIFKIPNMPIGKGAHIIAIAVINGQYYWADQSVLISSTQINLNMQPVTISQIQTQLSLLP